VLNALGQHADATLAYNTAKGIDASTAETTFLALSREHHVSVKPSAAGALDSKENGNAVYTNGDYTKALEHYVTAIAMQPLAPELHSNRAMVLLKMCAYKDAELSARRSIELNPKWPRGYERLAQALRLLSKGDEARSTLEDGLARCPKNEALQEALNALSP
jgi:tetratricopeptide (TPR) repeat protein